MRRKLALVLFPIGAATVAADLVIALLLGARFGVSVPLGTPLAWAAAFWVYHLLDEAQG